VTVKEILRFHCSSVILVEIKTVKSAFFSQRRTFKQSTRTFFVWIDNNISFSIDFIVFQELLKVGNGSI